jgi:hypothetical protein
MIHPRHAIAAGALAAAALLGPGAGAALAQTPAGSQYGGNLGQGAHGGPPAVAPAGATLPFTGADLGELAATGVGLIGAGVILRGRAARAHRAA